MAKEQRRRVSILDIVLTGVVLLLIATIVVPQWIAHRYRSHSSGSRHREKSDIIGIRNALEQYAIENNGRYPESLEALVRPDANGLRFLDRQQVPTDAWDRPYGYERPSTPDARPRVFALGSDGEVGGDGDAKDIDSEMILRGEV